MPLINILMFTHNDFFSLLLPSFLGCFWYFLPFRLPVSESLGVGGRIILKCILGKWEGVDWTHLAENSDRRRAVGDTITTFGFHERRGISKLFKRTISFSRTTLRGNSSFATDRGSSGFGLRRFFLQRSIVQTVTM
jgi:hypothetical protein